MKVSYTRYITIMFFMVCRMLIVVSIVRLTLFHDQTPHPIVMMMWYNERHQYGKYRYRPNGYVCFLFHEILKTMAQSYKKPFAIQLQKAKSITIFDYSTIKPTCCNNSFSAFINKEFLRRLNSFLLPSFSKSNMSCVKAYFSKSIRSMSPPFLRCEKTCLS